jgi:acyl-coenzyme A synthetase/AMP-(fatty) acid ligase
LPGGVPKSIGDLNVALGEVLRETARTYRNNAAIIYFGRRIPYGELVDRFAAALHYLGVKRYDRVGVQLLQENPSASLLLPDEELLDYGFMNIWKNIHAPKMK